MDQEQTPDEYPDTTMHIRDAFSDELRRIRDRVTGDEEAIVAEEAATRARELLKQKTDLRHEAAGAQDEAQELIAHMKWAGSEQGTIAAIKQLKDTVQQADVERINLPPE